MTSRTHVVGRVLASLARTERDKSCHLFPLPPDGQLPSSLRAYCGFTTCPAQLEMLETPHGMPCVSCMLLANTGR